MRAILPASALAPRQARAAVRDALGCWGLSALAGDAQLLTSELVANAVEHAGGDAVWLTIRQHTGPGGRHGITCEVTDNSPVLPSARAARPADQRGRGLTIVASLAAASGVTPTRDGKTAWFTLTSSADPACTVRQADFEAEPGA